MLIGQELDVALAELTPSPAQGVSFRLIHIRHQASPLSAIGSYRLGGRYNFMNQFEAFYTCDTPLQELTGDWQQMQKRGQIAPTQSLGLAAYNSLTIEALKVPSARDSEAYNLVIFSDRLCSSSFLEIYDNSGSIQARIL